MAKTIYDLIKQQNGEEFARDIRDHYNGIFDIPNIVDVVKYAGRKSKPIMQYLVSLKNISIEEQAVHLNPIDLLDKAGYKAWEVHNEEEQNSIAGYFRDERAVIHGMTSGNPRSDKGELICTIHTNWKYNEKRFDDFYVINAVKKKCLGDDKLPESQWHIKPADKPERADEYGTSVISIQAYKTGGFIKITNRYNHTIDNPDNTFNSNPDNIIRGLSDAIKHYFNVDFSSQKVGLPDNYIILKGQIIHYNKEINGIYFADDLYVKNGEITELNSHSQLMLPAGMLLDLQNKKVTSLIRPDDKFAMELTDVIKDKKLQIVKNQKGEKEVIADGKVVVRMSKTGSLFKYLYMPKFLNDDIGWNLRLSDYFVSGGTFDLSDVKRVRGYYTDCSNINILFNSKAESINLEMVKGLKGKLNFSNVKRLKLHDIDVSKAKVKFNSGADEIDIRMSNGLQKLSDLRYNFSGVKELRLTNCIDLKNTEILLNKNAKSIEIESCIALQGNHDFSNVNSLLIQSTDLSNANIIFNPKAQSIWLNDITRLKGFHNFSDVQELVLDKNFNKTDKRNVFDKSWKNAVSKVDVFKNSADAVRVIKKHNIMNPKIFKEHKDKSH